MKEQEVINELSGQLKPYVGVMPQSTYSSVIARYNAGTLKPNTLREFLKRFGYTKDGELWKKQ